MVTKSDCRRLALNASAQLMEDDEGTPLVDSKVFTADGLGIAQCHVVRVLFFMLSNAARRVLERPSNTTRRIDAATMADVLKHAQSLMAYESRGTRSKALVRSGIKLGILPTVGDNVA